MFFATDEHMMNMNAPIEWHLDPENCQGGLGFRVGGVLVCFVGFRVPGSGDMLPCCSKGCGVSGAGSRAALVALQRRGPQLYARDLQSAKTTRAKHAGNADNFKPQESASHTWHLNPRASFRNRKPQTLNPTTLNLKPDNPTTHNPKP